MTNPDELERAVADLEAFAAFWEQSDYLPEPVSPPAGMEASENGLSEKLRLILSANREMRAALEALLASTCGPAVGCGDGGTFVICPPSPDALRKARSALTTQRGDGE